MSCCSQCGAEFTCAMQDGQDAAPCWCTALPKLAIEQMPGAAPGAANASCLCPACLNRWIARQAKAQH